MSSYFHFKLFFIVWWFIFQIAEMKMGNINHLLWGNFYHLLRRVSVRVSNAGVFLGIQVHTICLVKIVGCKAASTWITCFSIAWITWFINWFEARVRKLKEHEWNAWRRVDPIYIDFMNKLNAFDVEHNEKFLYTQNQHQIKLGIFVKKFIWNETICDPPKKPQAFKAKQRRAITSISFGRNLKPWLDQ